MEHEIKRDYYLEQLIKRKNNGLIKIVIRSNEKFLSSDIATEFGGRGDEVRTYPLSFSAFMTIYGGKRYIWYFLLRKWQKKNQTNRLMRFHDIITG